MGDQRHKSWSSVKFHAENGQKAPVIGVRHKGKVTLLDGDHRAVAASLMKRPLAAKIIHIPHPTDQQPAPALAVDVHGHKHLGKGTQKEVTSTGAPAKGGEFARRDQDTDDADTAKQQKQQQPAAQPTLSVEQFEHPDSPAWTLKVEHSAVKLANGKDYYIAGDHHNQVTIPNEHRHMMKDAVYTHNHPAGTNALSIQDVLTAVSLDMAEMRAITVNNGKKQIISLKRPNGGWNPYIATEYKQAHDKIMREVQYSPTMHQTITENKHLALGLLATKYGAAYERKEI